ncbi:MAG: hypothetical protein LBM93_06750 [Oscillospiraceae bacterium]|jgi:HD superfamily phosphohydrolase YqeK|nr:hypothetical protein [Oscillospiraceae bacterium]
MNHIVKALSKELGVAPQEIEKAYKSGAYNDMLRNMPKSLQFQFATKMNNPQAIERLMSTPQAQSLIQKIKENES